MATEEKSGKQIFQVDLIIDNRLTVALWSICSAGRFFAFWRNNSFYFSHLILFFYFDADYHMITVRE